MADTPNTSPPNNQALIPIDETFKIRIFDVDLHHRLSVPALVNYLQELAWQHSVLYKVSINELLPMGFSWVLSRMKIVVERWPKHGEIITVKTWIVNNDKYFCYRDFLVTDSQGKIIVRSSSVWGILDINRRRIVAVPPYIADKFEYTEEQKTPQFVLNFKLPIVQSTDIQSKTTVRYHDLDINNHVNNMLYFQWVVEAFEADFLKENELQEIDLAFRAESSLGDNILCLREDLQDGNFAQRLVNQDGKELVTAKTLWAKRN